jgi:hypothetical protein
VTLSSRDPGISDAILVSPNPVFYVRNLPTVVFENETLDLEYTDAVSVYGSDLLDGKVGSGESQITVAGSWKASSPIYSQEEFDKYVGDLKAYAIKSLESDKGYLNITSVGWQPALKDSLGNYVLDNGKYTYGATFTAQGFSNIDHDENSVTPAVKDVLSVANLPVGIYRLRLIFGASNPTFSPYYMVDWSYDPLQTSATEGFSEYVKYLEFEIKPRNVDLDWGVTDNDKTALVSVDMSALYYKNSPFNIGAVFDSASAEYSSGISVRYVNLATYSYAEAVAAGNPDLAGANKPFNTTDAGDYEVEARLYRGSADVTSSYNIATPRYAYTIIKRELEVIWNQTHAKMQWTGEPIEIKPTVSPETRDQLEQINAEFSGFVYEGNIRTDEGQYLARTAELWDSGADSKNIWANVVVRDTFKGKHLPDGFAWSIIPAGVGLTVGGSSVSHTVKYGTALTTGAGGLIQAQGLDNFPDVAYQYQYENSDAWNPVTPTLSLLPGTYYVRAIYAQNSEVPEETPTVILSVVKADFSDDAVDPSVDLNEIWGDMDVELGLYPKASDLPLPTNANGTWVLDDPNQNLGTAGPHSVGATLIPHQDFLYNPKHAVFSLTIISELKTIQTKPDAVIILNDATGAIDNLPLGLSLTLADIRDQIINIQGIRFFDAGGAIIDDLSTPLATGQRVSLVDKGVSYDIVVSGDVDGDGQISLADAESILNHLEGDRETLSGVLLAAADIDGSGVVDILDFVDALLVKNGTVTVAQIRGVEPQPVQSKKEEN